MRFEPECKHGANAVSKSNNRLQGLEVARARMDKIKEMYPKLTYADLWSLAGVVAVQEMQGPNIPWRAGREDASVEVGSKSCTPDGRLPGIEVLQSYL
jgi:cytochrome c peroxidase